MAPLIYSLCAFTCAACLVLLWRGFRASRSRLLFWSALCFAFLTVNNFLLVLDKLLLPAESDLTIWRLVAALAAVLLLLHGLIWGEE
jgi:hypothetical protein